MSNSDNGNQSAGVLPAEFCGEGVNCMGLTKREAFAVAAMQGFTSGDVNQVFNTEQIARYSVEQADELLKALG